MPFNAAWPRCRTRLSDVSWVRIPRIGITKGYMAERVGFEPTKPREEFTGIPVQRLRPLGHLSASEARRLGPPWGRAQARMILPPYAPAELREAGLPPNAAGA